MPGVSVVVALVEPAWSDAIAAATETSQQMASLVGVRRHGHKQARLGIRDPAPSLSSPGVAPIRTLVEAGVACHVDVLRVEGINKNLPHVPGTIDRQEGPVAGAVIAAIDPLRAGERRIDLQRIDIA